MDDGKRIEEMIAKGLEVIEEVKRYIELELKTRIIGFVSAFSGGDDSIVVTHFANTTLDECVVFNADTMVGLKPTRDHIEKMILKHKWTAEIVKATSEGPPNLTNVNAEVIDNWREGGTAYEEFVLNHGFGGPAIHPRMYQRLKERQLAKLRRSMQNGIRGGRLVAISGIRHDESAIRAGYKRSWNDCPKQGVTWVNPFYNFTALDFELYRQEFGLTNNPVKRICGISGECCCGTFGNKSERDSYRNVDPVFSDYLDRLEEKVKERFPWGWGESQPKWWADTKRGQKFMCFEDGPAFQPMCVGCNNGRR